MINLQDLALIQTIKRHKQHLTLGYLHDNTMYDLE